MEMHQIRYFLNSCRTGNFTRAAELSHVSQPALTKAIRMLEEELGAPLFDRQVRPLRLTDLGRALHSRFSRIADLTTEIQRTAREHADLVGTSFSLGVINTLGDGRLVKLAVNLQRCQPSIAINLHSVSQEKLLEQMRQGTLELALLTEAPGIDSRYRTDPVFEDRFVVAMPPDHPLSAKPALSLKDLQGQDYINRLSCEKNAEIESLMAELEVTVMTHLVSDQDEFVRRMIKAGLGISIMPLSLAVEGLVTRPLEDPPVSRRIVLASLVSRQISEVAEMVRHQIINTIEGPAL